MPTIPNDEVIRIAKLVATANNVPYADVTAASTADSTGSEAIEITIVLEPGSASAIVGESSARTV